MKKAQSVCEPFSACNDGKGAHPLQQASRVLADVRQAADDVVQVEVAEGGVVLTLPPHLKNDDVFQRIQIFFRILF